jgi:hypothetical protein
LNSVPKRIPNGIFSCRNLAIGAVFFAGKKVSVVPKKRGQRRNSVFSFLTSVYLLAV